MPAKEKPMAAKKEPVPAKEESVTVPAKPEEEPMAAKELEPVPAKEEPYDILLLGKTGQGKSTTGNHLVENQDVTRIVDVLFEIRKTQKGKVTEKCLTKFEHSSGSKSCTNRPDVLYNKDTGIRVMDTKGFADSKLKPGQSSFTNNLGIMRSILTWQLATGMSFRRVLYFLPARTPLERMDANLQEEVEIILHFFGAGVFNCMVLVFTMYSGVEDSMTPDRMFGEDWESKTKNVMFEAIRRTAERLKVTLPEDFKCPPVVFISKAGPSEKVITTVKEAKVFTDQPYSVAFRETICVNCAASLIYPALSAKNADNPKPSKEFTDPVAVQYDNETPIQLAQSTCHPGFVSKYSDLQKFGGGVLRFFFLMLPESRTRLLEHELSYGPLPSFKNSEEVCIRCKEAPSDSRGCMKVNTHWKPDDSNQDPIRVSHISGRDA